MNKIVYDFKYYGGYNVANCVIVNGNCQKLHHGYSTVRNECTIEHTTTK